MLRSLSIRDYALIEELEVEFDSGLNIITGETGAGKSIMLGAIGLLLGNRKVRKMGGKAVTYGGLAALGVLAYKAYGNWQAQQGTAATTEPQTIDRLPAAQVEVAYWSNDFKVWTKRTHFNIKPNLVIAFTCAAMSYCSCAFPRCNLDCFCSD